MQVKKMIVNVDGRYYRYWYPFSDRRIHAFKCINVRGFSRQLSDLELCNRKTKDGYSIKFIENGLDRAILRVKYKVIHVLKVAGLMNDGYSKAKKRIKNIMKRNNG